MFSLWILQNIFKNSLFIENFQATISDGSWSLLVSPEPFGFAQSHFILETLTTIRSCIPSLRGSIHDTYHFSTKSEPESIKYFYMICVK